MTVVQPANQDGLEVQSLPLVVAVVLTWNDTTLTGDCLSSVLNSDYQNLKVVLVDNGSKPPVGPALKSDYPNVDLVQLSENLGFSGGANRGLERALLLGADYVHLIGNDATLAKHTISELVSECERNPDVGAAGPLLLEPGDTPIVQFYTATLDRNQALHYHHHVGEAYDSKKYPTVETEFIPCVALLLRATALREVGLFDESFGTCWEDYDLCIRLRDENWRYIVVGNATSTHIGSHTTGRASPYITYYTTRNRLICLDRYSSDLKSTKRLLALAKSFLYQVRSYGFLNWPCHRAFVKGFYDYFKSRHGERVSTKTGQIPGL